MIRNVYKGVHNMKLENGWKRAFRSRTKSEFKKDAQLSQLLLQIVKK